MSGLEVFDDDDAEPAEPETVDADALLPVLLLQLLFLLFPPPPPLLPTLLLDLLSELNEGEEPVD